MISHSYWQRRFNGDPSAIGRTIVFPEGQMATIVGVMPLGFHLWTRQVDIFQGISSLATIKGREVRWLYAVGRLKSDASVELAQHRLSVIARDLAEKFPSVNAGWSVNVESYRDALGAGTNQRPMLYALSGAVSFTLLIACLNVANLLLTRALSRRREFAIRAALGAARGRLIRQMLADGAVLAFPAALFGVLLGAWALALFSLLVPLEFRALAEFSISAPVLAFTVAVSVVACLAVTLVPAIQSSRPDLLSGLRNSGTRNVSRPVAGLEPCS
jgi:putative ABC transport system permease protein